MASAISNRQNCTCARKTLQTQRGRTHGAGCVRQWFRTAEPLGERRYENWNSHTFDVVTANLIGRTHGTPYRGYGCVPLRFGSGGRGGERERRWENGNTTTKDAVTRCQTWISIPHMVVCAELPYKKSNFMPVIMYNKICTPACCLGFLVNRV